MKIIKKIPLILSLFIIIARVNAADFSDFKPSNNIVIFSTATALMSLGLKYAFDRMTAIDIPLHLDLADQDILPGNYDFDVTSSDLKNRQKYTSFERIIELLNRDFSLETAYSKDNKEEIEKIIRSSRLNNEDKRTLYEMINLLYQLFDEYKEFLQDTLHDDLKEAIAKFNTFIVDTSSSIRLGGFQQANVLRPVIVPDSHKVFEKYGLASAHNAASGFYKKQVLAFAAYLNYYTRRYAKV